jgi:aldehyde dehydrogenase (NAD+)
MPFENYIDGAWEALGHTNTFSQRNPADLQEVTGDWPAATEKDAIRAVEAAERAFPAWSALSPVKRAEYLKRVHRRLNESQDEIAAVLTRENGKTLAESKAEILSAVREMEFQIHEGLRMYGETIPSAQEGVFSYSVRRPLGVVSIISPWNFPLNVPTRKLTPALMAGNTCVFKPASLTPQTGYLLARYYHEAGLPPGVLNFVTGSGSSVGSVFTTDPRIRAVSFTGSTDVGRRIARAAAENLIRTQLEMGGKNPIVVLEDATIEEAAASAVTAAYACAGQWCTSTSRAIVVESAYRRFVDAVTAGASDVVVGNGLDESADMGPVCGEAQLRSIVEYIQVGEREGAKIAVGGSRLSEGRLAQGCFVEPTVFVDVTPGMRIAQEEIFGPVLSVLRVKDLDEAVEVANRVQFGLSSSVYTTDLSRALTFLERTDVGLTHVNMMTAYKQPHLTFGGVKASGFGIPEAGKTGIEFFTEHKVAYVKYR